MRRAYQLFHAVLALSLLFMGVRALLHGLHELDGEHLHLAFVGALEAVGAVLLLLPRTVKVGGILLLFVVLPSFAIHLTRGELELRYLIYATGIWLVMSDGAAWSRDS